MCIQNLRGMIVNTSYNVNETDANVHSLKELTDFNEPMVAVSSSLGQAKVNVYVSYLSKKNLPLFEMSVFSGTFCSAISDSKRTVLFTDFCRKSTLPRPHNLTCA